MSFPDQLRAIRDKNHSKNHPFFELWALGKLTKKQTALYCIQHHHYVTDYINWLAYEASQIPQRDVKAYLFENLSDEQGQNHFATGITSDIMSALLRHRWLTVIGTANMLRTGRFSPG